MELFIAISLILCLLIYVICIIIIVRRKHGPNKNEKIVNHFLEDFIKGKTNYFLIKNVILPFKGTNKTREIDHILFTPYGIFVIETKGQSGYIFGSKEDSEWFHIMGRNNQLKHTFPNPIDQVTKHVNALRTNLRFKNVEIMPIVVFVNGELHAINEPNVINFSELKYYLEDAMQGNTYEERVVVANYKSILKYIEHPIKTKKEHIRDIKKLHKDH